MVLRSKFNHENLLLILCSVFCERRHLQLSFTFNSSAFHYPSSLVGGAVVFVVLVLVLFIIGSSNTFPSISTPGQPSAPGNNLQVAMMINFNQISSRKMMWKQFFQRHFLHKLKIFRP